MGRPTKLTPEVQEKICQFLKDGNFYYTAALCSNISYYSFRLWMEKGSTQKRGRYYEFFNAVKEAEAECEAELVKKWKAQCPEDWNAIRAFLERRHRTRWAKIEKIDVKHGGKIETTADDLKGTLTQMLDVMAKRLEEADVGQPNDEDSKDADAGEK